MKGIFIIIMNNRITIRPKLKGKIYLIRCKDVPIYIGKTINMENRWRKHKRQPKLPMRQHMAEFGFQLHDYIYEILETLPVVGKDDPKLSQAEGKHFHCFIEQGYKLINKDIPNNGVTSDKNSITYSNNLASKNIKLPCELCGKVGAHGHMPRHQKTEQCKKGRDSYSYILMYQFVTNLTN